MADTELTQRVNESVDHFLAPRWLPGGLGDVAPLKAFMGVVLRDPERFQASLDYDDIRTGIVVGGAAESPRILVQLEAVRIGPGTPEFYNANVLIDDGHSPMGHFIVSVVEGLPRAGVGSGLVAKTPETYAKYRTQVQSGELDCVRLRDTGTMSPETAAGHLRLLGALALDYTVDKAATRAFQERLDALAAPTDEGPQT